MLEIWLGSVIVRKGFLNLWISKCRIQIFEKSHSNVRKITIPKILCSSYKTGIFIFVSA